MHNVLKKIFVIAISISSLCLGMAPAPSDDWDLPEVSEWLHQNSSSCNPFSPIPATPLPASNFLSSGDLVLDNPIPEGLSGYDVPESPAAPLPATEIKDDKNHVNQSISSTVAHIHQEEENRTYHPLKKRKRSKAEELQCSKCSTSWKKPSALKRHMLIHASKKPFQCLACLQAFSDIGNLERHYVNHVLIKQPSLKFFSCAKCEKEFSRRTHVQSHLRSASHKVEKQEMSKFILIDRANKALVKKEVLKLKAQYAIPATPLPSDNVLFPEDLVLNNALRTHTDEKPFQCLACQKEFTNKRSLEYHYINHVLVNNSSLKFASCAQCREQFAHREYVRCHLQSPKHNVAKEDVNKFIRIDAKKEALVKKLVLELKEQHARKQ